MSDTNKAKEWDENNLQRTSRRVGVCFIYTLYFEYEVKSLYLLFDKLEGVGPPRFKIIPDYILSNEEIS